jgi:hypothetical protein
LTANQARTDRLLLRRIQATDKVGFAPMKW